MSTNSPSNKLLSAWLSDSKITVILFNYLSCAKQDYDFSRSPFLPAAENDVWNIDIVVVVVVDSYR